MNRFTRDLDQPKLEGRGWAAAKRWPSIRDREGVMMKVREPDIEDAPALGAVHVRAWQKGYRGGLVPDEYLDGLSVEDRAEMWAEGLDQPPRARFARFVVEDEQGAVVGFVTAGPADGDTASETGEIYALNVDPDVWGSGYGQALLEAAIRALVEVGFDSAVLWVHPANQRARRFYERRGWQTDGTERRQEVLGVEVPEVRYERTLPTSSVKR